VAVDAECGQALLCVAGQNGSQVNCAGALGAVEAPYTLNGVRIHIHSLRAVAPAGGDGQSDGYAFLLKLVSASGSLGYTADGGISHNDLYGLTIGVEQVLLEQLLCSLSHCPDQGIQRLTEHHRSAAAVDDGANADYGIIANISVICHIDFLHNEISKTIKTRIAFYTL